MADQSSAFEQWFVKSSYQEFVKQEGLPMYEGSALENLAGLSLADWERRGKAAYTRLGNQEDYSLQIVETPSQGYELPFMPGQQKNRQKVPAKPYTVDRGVTTGSYKKRRYAQTGTAGSKRVEGDMLSSRPENFSQAPYEVIACRKGGFHEEVQFVDFCPGAS